MTWLTGGAAVVAGLFLFTLFRAKQAERAVPPQGRFLEVEGGRVHYVDRGSGRPLVLIHGLGGTLWNFTHSLVERLEGDFRVVAVDRPGAGYSTRSPYAEAGPFADGRAVAQLIHALELDQPVIVGHSLGGAVALALTLQHPDMVSGLALVAPLTNRQDAPPAVFKGVKIASLLLRKVLAWTTAIPANVLLRPHALKVIFGPEEVPDDFSTRGGGHLIFRPRAFAAASADLVSVPSTMPELLERYPEIRVPVGILYGRSDQILDPEEHGAGVADRFPDARLEMVEGGHMLPITQPEVVADFVGEVVRRSSGA